MAWVWRHTGDATPSSDTRPLGNRGEELVAQRLCEQGFAIVARNYRQQYGEIDIIAAKDEQLVFVEVKVRRPSAFGLDHLISPAKQRKIAMVAREYVGRHDITDKVCQFDVALLEWHGTEYLLNYIENAFTADS